MAYLIDELERLAAEAPGERGRSFENILAKLFEQWGFRVHRGPKSAKPRQSDLLAAYDNYAVLIEAKAQAKPLGSPEVDDLRSRLARVPTHVIGAMFSLSEFSNAAVREVEAHRDREILLFSPPEVRALCTGDANIFRLIQKKRESLTVNGTVWFFKPNVSNRSELVTTGTDRHFVLKKGAGEILPCLSDNADVTFALSIPDTGWGGYGAPGVVLTLPLRLDYVNDLRNIFQLIHEHFGPLENTWFSIHQLTASWFGFGYETLLAEAQRWRERYDASGIDRPHHSEDFSLFAEFLDGWLHLSVRQRVDWERPETHLHSSELVIQLPGVPVDLGPFQRLCRETGNLAARFLPATGRGVDMVRLKKRQSLTLLGEVVETSARRQGAVSGVVVENPYFRRPDRLKTLRDESMSPLFLLSSVEYLICSLKDWYDLGDKIRGLDLLRIEAMWAGDNAIIRPVCTWRNIVGRSAANMS